MLLEACLQVAARDPVDGVLAIAELDLMRGNDVADLLGCQNPAGPDVATFRDKLLMKQALDRAGVPVAAWAAADNYADLLRAARRFGFPVVLKPRFGSGSVGVQLARDAAALHRAARSLEPLAEDGMAGWLVEEYVPGDLYHVDGLVVAGRTELVWPSAYYGGDGCLGHQDGHPIGSAMLVRSDPLWEPLVEFVGDALAALPTPPTHLFHAEIFVTPTGLRFNEVGIRLGGGWVGPMLTTAFEVDMVECYVRAALGQPVTLPQQPGRLSGGVLISSATGYVAAVPDRCLIPGVVEYRSLVAVGDPVEGAEASTDHVASFVVAGPDRTAVADTLDSAIAWFGEGFRVEPSGPHRPGDGPGAWAAPLSYDDPASVGTGVGSGAAEFQGPRATGLSIVGEGQTT
jgi:hypothetical protein